MLAIGIAFPLMNAILEYFYYNDVPLTAAYAFCSVFTLVAWAGVRRHIGIPDYEPGLSKVKVKKSTYAYQQSDVAVSRDTSTV